MAEGEYIKLDIIPLGDLWKSTPDAKALCALALFDCLKRQGTLPQSAQTVGQTAVTSAAELVPTAQATAAAAADAEAEDDEHGGDDEQREAAAQSKTTERASSSLLLAGGCEDAVPPQSASSARSSQSVRAKKTPFFGPRAI
jgi:hypothetical protein